MAAWLLVFGLAWVEDWPRPGVYASVRVGARGAGNGHCSVAGTAALAPRLGRNLALRQWPV